MTVEKHIFLKTWYLRAFRLKRASGDGNEISYRKIVKNDFLGIKYRGFGPIYNTSKQDSYLNQVPKGAYGLREQS